jgi:hypothetical protein
MFQQLALNQKSLTEFRSLSLCDLAGWTLACEPKSSQFAPVSQSREYTRSRTISAYRNLMCFDRELPDFFDDTLLIINIFRSDHLQFCSVSIFACWCKWKLLRRIQSLRDFAVGSTGRPVTKSRLWAHSKNLSALSFLLLQNDFLRFLLPFQSRHLQKDITCSTKS